MELIHQRKLNRLRNYDYSSCGYYFVTICTQNREHFFGEVIDGKMFLTEYGEAADLFCKEIPLHYKNVELDEYVIMPDHMHCIIVIENTNTIENGKPNHYGLLSKIVKSYKEACLKYIRKNFNDYEFAWQRLYYDNIVRNEYALNNIRQYIRDNPINWDRDKNNLP